MAGLRGCMTTVQQQQQQLRESGQGFESNGNVWWLTNGLVNDDVLVWELMMMMISKRLPAETSNGAGTRI